MSPLLTINESEEIEQATKIMIEKGIRHIAVKKKQSDYKIVGIISTTDLARYLRDKSFQNHCPQVIRIINANVLYKDSK